VTARGRVIDELAATIHARVRGGGLRVGIDGPDAAGKTTLADELASALEPRGHRVRRSSIDDFLRPPDERYRRGRDSPRGYYEDSFDYAAVRRLLDACPADDALLVFDGVFLLRPELADVWDFRIFVSVSVEECLRRAVARDAAVFGSEEEVVRRYRARYIPGQALYLAEARPGETADVVVVNDDPARPLLRASRP
jgi:uridine kinase